MDDAMFPFSMTPLEQLQAFAETLQIKYERTGHLTPNELLSYSLLQLEAHRRRMPMSMARLPDTDPHMQAIKVKYYE